MFTFLVFDRKYHSWGNFSPKIKIVSLSWYLIPGVCSTWEFIFTYIFSASLKFRACYITGKWGGFTVENVTVYLRVLSWHILVFFIKNLVFFFSFSFLLLIRIEFLPWNINQSETRISGKKLSVELYNWSNSNMQNFMVMFTFSVLDRKYLLLANLVQKFKICKVKFGT